MIDEKLIRILRCPICGNKVVKSGGNLFCGNSGDLFKISPEMKYVDMRPGKIDHRKSVYGDENFVGRRGQLEPGPPFLSGGIKNWVIKSMIRFQKGETVLDAGCGPGRYILWNLSSGADFIGLDMEPFFSNRITDKARLVRGYLHFMPFAGNSFDAIVSLDVLEHMAITDIKKFLKSSALSLKPDGRLLIYTNSTESSALAPLIRFRQRITAWLIRKGMADFELEKESKEDHINAIKTETELIRLAERAGLRLTDNIYYNPVIMGWFENLLLKFAEQRVNNKLRKKKEHNPKSTGKTPKKTDNAKQKMKERTGKKGFYYLIFWMITAIMKLDIILFSNVKSGQFFLLFEKKE